jgi:pterin-4a-carbinolamine dehydratase
MEPLAIPKIYQFLDTVSGRTYEQNILSNTYEFESFLEALSFVNDLAEVVENM